MDGYSKIICDPIFYKDLKNWLPEAEITTFYSDPLPGAFDYLYDYKNEEYVVMLFNAIGHEDGNLQVRDHINLTFNNPLIGKNDDTKGVRFPDLSNVYIFSNDEESTVIASGETRQLSEYKDKIFTVKSGLNEAIVLAHAGIKIKAWLIGNLAEFYQEKIEQQ